MYVSGELIGVQYLYSQTGQVLQEFLEETDNEDAVGSKSGEDTVVEPDEGFGDETEIEDPTMPHEEVDQLPPAPKRPASKRTLKLPEEDQQQQEEQQPELQQEQEPTQELDPEVSSQTSLLLSDYSLEFLCHLTLIIIRVRTLTTTHLRAGPRTRFT